MLEQIARIMLDAAAGSLKQLLPVLLPLLGFGWLIHHCSRMLERSAVRLLGVRGYLYLFGWLGTAVHELGHALFCPLFGHRITAMRLCSFNPRSRDTGYVSHEFNGLNPYHSVGNFFISIGPLVLGSALIYVVLRYLAGLPFALETGVALPRSLAGWGWTVAEQGGRMLAGMARRLDLLDFRLYLALYLVLSIGSAMTLSTNDLLAAGRGLGLLLLLVLGLNLVLVLSGVQPPGVEFLLPLVLALSLLSTIVLTLCLSAALVLGLLGRLTGRRD